MKIDENKKVIELTERNLRSLLAKLEGYPNWSACTLQRCSEQNHIWNIVAVIDEHHYSERPAGRIHPETEVHMEASDG